MRAAHPLERAGAFGFHGNWVTRFPKPVRLGVANPRIGLEELDRVECEDSLHAFVETFWSVLEPERPHVPSKAQRVVCEHLEYVNTGQIRKLLINIPPGFSKSLSTNVFFPAWEWGPRGQPGLRYISASYSQDLTYRDNRRGRQLINDPKYQRLWGDRFAISSDQDAKGKYENDKRGFRFATSVSGVATGERGDRIIVDDPHNLKEAESERKRQQVLQWFSEVLPSRVNDPKTAAFIVIMQRVHENDVSGLILSSETGYEHLCLPMEYESDHPHLGKSSIGFSDWRNEEGELLWPEYYDRDSVNKLKADLRSWGGSYAEAGQLQQRPSPRGGGMFKRAWWRFYRSPVGLLGRPAGCSDHRAELVPGVFDEVVVSCDAAFKDSSKGSRVAILVIGRKGPFRYVLDNRTDHMTFRQTCDRLLEVTHLWNARRVLVEDKANGPAIIDTLRQSIAGVIAIAPEGGKESRASAIQPAVESGHVMLPEGAPWLADLVSEFSAFPVGQHDDQVDALSQALIYMTASRDVARLAGAKW